MFEEYKWNSQGNNLKFVVGLVWVCVDRELVRSFWFYFYSGREVVQVSIVIEEGAGVDPEPDRAGLVSPR